MEPDSYDKLLKGLVFDRKATATERTKTPEEIARERAEKLEALERSSGCDWKLESFFLALLDFSINVMARSDGDISARGMQVVYALRRPLLELANEFPEEATKYFLELLQECDTGATVVNDRCTSGTNGLLLPLGMPKELKQMATEFDKSMNTTFGSFSKTKERKKANRRMAGNATAENPKQPKAKGASEKAAPGAAKEAPKASKKAHKGGKRKARRL
eukprot:Skav227282  [mRNA]  locus=scaffold4796:13711:23184:+ [translate_table: standard]